ncbi:MAG: adenylosuccinate lyase [Actinobacteria bacterium]|nr:adenylosuccinate lyase [Actinomycetota bacterium]
MDNRQYQHPLVQRNASAEMIYLFSPAKKFGTWRRLWLALAESQRELGLKITAKQIRAMQQHLDDIDYSYAAKMEKKLRHDVMAHVHTFAKAAPEAGPIIHLGATSAFVGDNTDLIIIREGLELIRARLVNVIDALGKFARRYKSLPTLGRTHLQPAQLTTVGKRATLWAQDLVLDLGEIQTRLDKLAFRGTKGTTGTQASFLALFDGDHKKVARLEKLVAKKMGFRRCYPVTGQTYPRKVDAQVVYALAGIATSVQKFCNDIRILASIKEIEEPFEKSQVGSSAMAYKRNPMRCERATGLARFVLSMANSPAATAAEQMFERTLDDSANRRITLPEAFMAVDGILLIMQNVTSGLLVYPKVIAAHVAEELPFMATENILMAGVKAGGNRQELHERIRKHSQAAGRVVKIEGKANDLIERLKADPAFSKVNFTRLLRPRDFIGRGPEQVDEFVRDVITPIRRRYRALLGTKVELKV